MTPMEKEEFASEIAEQVAAKLACQPRLVDRCGLAKLLGVSVPTIDRLKAAGKIPFHDLGKRCQRFDPDAVIRALSDGDADAAVRHKHKEEVLCN